MQTFDRNEVLRKIVAFVESFPTVCCNSRAHIGSGRLSSFSGQESNCQFDSRFFFVITCDVDVQMAHASPFSTSTLRYLSNVIKNTMMRGVFTPAIEL